MTTGPSTRLTWHQGSVLPYSSLWHTVQRAMSLNALRPRELAFCGRASEQVVVPRHINLLFNETGDGLRGTPVEALSMPSLAQVLGEPEAAFAWAHLGRLPRSVRSLISPSIRVCRTCLAAGYHSALHSLRLLQTCPIHDCELADRCNCGELFTGDQVVLHHMNAGYCRCGRMAFFTSQTCRRPTLRHDETAPMSMVAAWLERLAGVIRPLPSDRQTQWAHDRILLDSVGAWCAELNLGNPGSAITPDPQPLRTSISVARLSTIERANAVRPATHSRQGAASTRGRHSLYWSHDDATTIYRSLARHIRRHVARGAEAHAIDFMLNPDPLQMGATMRTQRQAMVAFADLLFTECMETYAGLRRWPYRDPQAGATRWVRDGLVQLSVDGGRDWPQALRDARLAWVRRQAAAAAITHAWRRAQMLAVHAAATGFADWSAATERYLPAGAISSTYIDRPKPSGTAFWFDAPPPYQATWAAVVSGEHCASSAHRQCPGSTGRCRVRARPSGRQPGPRPNGGGPRSCAGPAAAHASPGRRTPAGKCSRQPAPRLRRPSVTGCSASPARRGSGCLHGEAALQQGCARSGSRPSAPRPARPSTHSGRPFGSTAGYVRRSTQCCPCRRPNLSRCRRRSTLNTSCG